MKSFNEVSNYDFENGRIEALVKEIQSKGKEYILGIDEQEFCDYLFEKYTLEPLKVDLDSEFYDIPISSKERIENLYHDGMSSVVEFYSFTIKYSFTGSAELFRVQSTPWIMSSYEIDVDSQKQIVSYKFKIHKQDPEEFIKVKKDCYRKAFANLDNMNKNVNDFNNKLRSTIQRSFQREKEKYLKQNDFFAAINIKINQETKSVFSVPTITKKVIPQPTISKNKEFSSEPMMSSEMYNDVLKVIYDSGKNMEKKTALYFGKNEEGLRDQFLFVLETRYEGTTATGETFNRTGKTDIILKYADDGSNLFVAECKFWHGPAEFLAAISQLFERYLTWRDSKAALLMFVKNQDFSNVLSSIKTQVKNHNLFIKETGFRGETSFSYIFCLPQDRNKQVHFEIMAFHYDKK